MGHETEPKLLLPEAAKQLEHFNGDLEIIDRAAADGLDLWSLGPEIDLFYKEDTEILKKMAYQAGQLAVTAASLSERLEKIRHLEEELPDTSSWMTEFLHAEDIPNVRQPEG